MVFMLDLINYLFVIEFVSFVSLNITDMLVFLFDFMQNLLLEYLICVKQLSLNESFGFVLDFINYPFVIEFVSFVSLKTNDGYIAASLKIEQNLGACHHLSNCFDITSGDHQIQ